MFYEVRGAAVFAMVQLRAATEVALQMQIHQPLANSPIEWQLPQPSLASYHIEQSKLATLRSQTYSFHNRTVFPDNPFQALKLKGFLAKPRSRPVKA